MASKEEIKEKIPLAQESDENTRKIPKCIFIENIEEFVKKHSAQKIGPQMQQLYGQYKFMEGNMVRQKDSLKNKLPDIRKTLQCVKMLKEKHNSEKKEVQTHYLLSDNMWANVRIPNDNGTVMLWLGANTMVEFPFDDAQKLLTQNLVNGEANIVNLEKDLDFLKAQLTTVQVNIARLHNEVQRVKRQQAGK